ncbi:hypothetical protein XACJJ10_2560015 [Xanthomonas citri pv. citri]|nr:hypothetical protein XACJJ10_2560015 [Xanthomonas citri pv. citri]
MVTNDAPGAASRVTKGESEKRSAGREGKHRHGHLPSRARPVLPPGTLAVFVGAMPLHPSIGKTDSA